MEQIRVFSASFRDDSGNSQNFPLSFLRTFSSAFVEPHD